MGALCQTGTLGRPRVDASSRGSPSSPPQAATATFGQHTQPPNGTQTSHALPGNHRGLQAAGILPAHARARPSFCRGAALVTGSVVRLTNERPRPGGRRRAPQRHSLRLAGACRREKSVPTKPSVYRAYGSTSRSAGFLLKHIRTLLLSR